MKFCRLFGLALALTVLPSCITTTSKDTSVYQPSLPPVAHSLSRNISFSVSSIANYGGEEWFGRETLKEEVRKKLEQSGLFDSVYYVDIKNASPNHIHFAFEQSGTSYDDKIGLGMALGCVFLAVPGWLTMDLSTSASVMINGNEVNCFHTKWTGQDTIWLPLVIATPFCNHATTGRSMLRGSIDEVLEQVKTSRR